MKGKINKIRFLLKGVLLVDAPSTRLSRKQNISCIYIRLFNNQVYTFYFFDAMDITNKSKSIWLQILMHEKDPTLMSKTYSMLKYQCFMSVTEGHLHFLTVSFIKLRYNTKMISIIQYFVFLTNLCFNCLHFHLDAAFQMMI